MKLPSFLLTWWRHFIFAAVICILGLFLAEWAIPGSVLPFFVPYPFIAALLVLVATVPMQPEPTKSWLRVFTSVILVSIMAIMLLLISLRTNLSTNQRLLLFGAVAAGSLAFTLFLDANTRKPSQPV